MKKSTNINAGKVTTVVCALIMSTSSLAQDNKLSDPDVAFVAVTANQIDISYAAIAKEKSKDLKVISFAETMKRDHTAVIAQAAALVKKLGVTPTDNEVSKSLIADAEKTKKWLHSQSAAAFNKAYIDNEVTYHKAIIAAVEDVLIPETESKELKVFLQNIVPALKAHLEHAQMLQQNYK